MNVSEHPPEAGGNPERLQKILAAAGLTSRRKAETLILEGRVQVNGQVVTTLGAKADPARDAIRVDGKRIRTGPELRYFLFNKPKGHVATASDPEGRPTVMDAFARVRGRMFPVGRLDFHSEGLLLVTNDGALANTLTRAASHVEKTYLVKVSGVPSESGIEKLRRGISIPVDEPGSRRVRTAPAKIRLFRSGDNPWYEVTLIEGRNRQIRKMFEEIGHHVEKIRRTGYGPLVLDVPPGEYRELTRAELESLRDSARPAKRARPARTADSGQRPRPAAPSSHQKKTPRSPRRTKKSR
jgi:23S rRNA pseudouridine2605 synthase